VEGALSHESTAAPVARQDCSRVGLRYGGRHSVQNTHNLICWN
jgi:hypothetical protein